jgi:hypothetical protein
MAEPENHAVRLLREIRAAIKAMDSKIDGNHQELTDRLDSLKRFAWERAFGSVRHGRVRRTP